MQKNTIEAECEQFLIWIIVKLFTVIVITHDKTIPRRK